MRPFLNDLTSRFVGVSRMAREIARRQKAEQRQPSRARAAAAAQEPAPSLRGAHSPGLAPVAVAAPVATAARAASPVAPERARVAAVFASEHSTGRERQAADLLGTSATADEIIRCLAGSPRSDPLGATMLARLKADRNPDLGAGNGDVPDRGAAADRAWGRLWQGDSA